VTPQQILRARSCASTPARTGWPRNDEAHR
jgi:hypothetical protein